MPRYIGAYRGGVRPSAPTSVYRASALFFLCHSEPVTDVTGSGIRPPFYVSGGQRPLPTFAASRQRRDLIIAQTPGGCFQRGRAAALPLGRFKGKRFLRKGGNRNPPFLKPFFGYFLSGKKVTRRWQKKSEKPPGGRLRPPLPPPTKHTNAKRDRLPAVSSARR